MRPLPLRSGLLVAVALVTLPLGCACGPEWGSLGDLATDTGEGGGSGNGTGNADGVGGGSPDCPPIQLADVANGIGGFTMDGEAENDRSGWSARGAGDVNGDGFADVIVGAGGADPNGEQSGRAYVVFGKADTDRVSLVDIARGVGGFALDGQGTDDEAGFSVSGAGDVNGDGLADLVVGAPWAGPDQPGRAYVVFGKVDTHNVSLAAVSNGLGGFAVHGEPEGQGAGWSVSKAGDVNGDGLADIVMGAGVEDSVRAYVVFGKADTDAVQLADVVQGIGGFMLDNEASGDYLAPSVSSAGDVNGDGLGDVVVGAVEEHISGRAYVVFGKADTDAVQLAEVSQGSGGFAVDGEDARDIVGISVGGGGDVDGDGRDDLVLASCHGDSPGFSSGTYAVSGKAETDTVELAEVRQGIGGFAIAGEVVTDWSDWSVANAGDLNRDGLDDVIVGAAWASPNGLSRSGRSYVVFGKRDTTSAELVDVTLGMGGFAMDGEAEGDQSGYAVGGAGDVNGDGIPDLVVAAPSADPNGLNEAGRTYVVFGGDFSCEGR